MSQATARQLRDQPYRSQAEAALAARFETAARPVTLRALLRWYAESLANELPAELHDPGVWRDYGEAAVGASALGAPKYTDAFRRYIEGSARQTDPDGHYLFPIGAALAYLDRSSPRVVTWLVDVARAGFDYRRAADFRAKAHDQAKAETYGAVSFLWEAYCPSPPLSIRRETGQEAANAA